MSFFENFRFGFRWGPMEVSRRATFPRKTGEEHVIRVATKFKSVDVYVSPTGRSIRVYSAGKEWKP